MTATTATRTRLRAAPGALLLAASLALALPAEAQEETEAAAVASPPHPTSLETYLERPGILLVKRHHPLAPVELSGGAQLELDAVSAHEPGMQHQRVMGIRIEVEGTGLNAEERVFHIDVHEIEELVRAIDFMTRAMGGKNPARGSDRAEMSISTQDGFEVGVRFAGGGTSPFVGTRSVRFALRRAALEDLKTKLNAGREYLFSD